MTVARMVRDSSGMPLAILKVRLRGLLADRCFHSNRDCIKVLFQKLDVGIDFASSQQPGVNGSFTATTRAPWIPAISKSNTRTVSAIFASVRLELIGSSRY